MLSEKSWLYAILNLDGSGPEALFVEGALVAGELPLWNPVNSA